MRPAFFKSGCESSRYGYRVVRRHAPAVSRTGKPKFKRISAYLRTEAQPRPLYPYECGHFRKVKGNKVEMRHGPTLRWPTSLRLRGASCDIDDLQDPSRIFTLPYSPFCKVVTLAEHLSDRVFCLMPVPVTFSLLPCAFLLNCLTPLNPPLFSPIVIPVVSRPNFIFGYVFSAQLV